MTPPKGIWLSITDQEVEGEWRDFFTNKVLPSYSIIIIITKIFVILVGFMATVL